MKTQIETHSDTKVTIRFDDEFGDRQEMTLTRPDNGGYVRQVLDNGNRPQVCEELSSMGSTLMCGESTPLVNIVRREWRRRRESINRLDIR